MVEQKKKLTPAHIRKIKETYHKKNLDKVHGEVIKKYWANKQHEYNKNRYRKKLAEAKKGDKNPNSSDYKKKK